ncbi:hypothetical protein KBY29_09605 [Ruegeria pomeroyi]|nr:hypothetical protein [Ruegeria pomeroyi]
MQLVPKLKNALSAFLIWMMLTAAYVALFEYLAAIPRSNADDFSRFEAASMILKGVYIFLLIVPLRRLGPNIITFLLSILCALIGVFLILFSGIAFV